MVLNPGCIPNSSGKFSEISLPVSTLQTLQTLQMLYLIGPGRGPGMVFKKGSSGESNVQPGPKITALDKIFLCV